MMFKIIQDLFLPQSPKHPSFSCRSLKGNQFLNLEEGHQLLDPLLWPSIIEDTQVLGVLGSWVVCIHEEIHLDQFCLVHIRPIYLVHLIHLGSKWNVEIFAHKRSESSGRLENLLISIVQNDLAHQKCVTVL
jgi:hypothetical protein